jgi:hypothetical protein
MVSQVFKDRTVRAQIYGINPHGKIILSVDELVDPTDIICRLNLDSGFQPLNTGVSKLLSQFNLVPGELKEKV